MEKFLRKITNCKIKLKTHDKRKKCSKSQKIRNYVITLILPASLIIVK